MLLQLEGRWRKRKEWTETQHSLYIKERSQTSQGILILRSTIVYVHLALMFVVPQSIFYKYVETIWNSSSDLHLMHVKVGNSTNINDPQYLNPSNSEIDRLQKTAAGSLYAFSLRWGGRGGRMRRKGSAEWEWQAVYSHSFPKIYCAAQEAQKSAWGVQGGEMSLRPPQTWTCSYMDQWSFYVQSGKWNRKSRLNLYKVKAAALNITQRSLGRI